METSTAHQIKEINWPEKTFVAKKATIAFDKLPAFFGKSYGAIYGILQRENVSVTEPPCAIYYSIDEAKQQTDLAAAVPAKGVIPEIEGFEKIVIPPSKLIATTYYGPYENMQPVYAELEQYLLDHNLKRELIIEEYLSDPQVEKDPAKWKTNIYFIVK